MVEDLRSKNDTAYGSSLIWSQEVQELIMSIAVGPVKGEVVRAEWQRRGFMVELLTHQQDRQRGLEIAVSLASSPALRVPNLIVMWKQLVFHPVETTKRMAIVIFGPADPHTNALSTRVDVYCVASQHQFQDHTSYVSWQG